eukprot:evm.model.scf_930.5 EVM.evm.TU.scf_930.5   scf_930:35496-36376(-)
MAWTDEVHEHRLSVERRRARMRSQGVHVSDENRTGLMPLALVVAVVAGIGWWRREGHKLRRSAFPGAGVLARVLGREAGEDGPRRKAVEAARRRLQGIAGGLRGGEWDIRGIQLVMWLIVEFVICLAVAAL